MKSINTLVLVGILSINISLQAEQIHSAFILSEEKFINDIPFNTESIYRSFMETEAGISAMNTLPEEGNIDDIPFSTSAIVASDFLIREFNEKELTSEPYINDIPFNTGEIAARNAVRITTVALKDEPFVNDIPFDTQKIAAASLISDQWLASDKNLAEDSYVDDIPFSTESVASQYEHATQSNSDETRSCPLVECPAEYQVVNLEIDEKALESLTTESRELMNMINNILSEQLASIKPAIEANIQQVRLSVDEQRNTIQTQLVNRKCAKSKSNCCLYAEPGVYFESGKSANNNTEIKIIITKE